MHDTMLTVSYESLGKLLKQIQESEAVNSSPELVGQVAQAMSFHQQMASEILALKQEYQLLNQKLSQATREPGERVCFEPNPDWFSKYEVMKGTGATPQEVYSAVRKDGFSRLEGIMALRQVFNIPLSDAKEVLAQIEPQFHQFAA